MYVNAGSARRTEGVGGLRVILRHDVGIGGRRVRLRLDARDSYTRSTPSLTLSKSGCVTVENAVLEAVLCCGGFDLRRSLSP